MRFTDIRFKAFKKLKTGKRKKLYVNYLRLIMYVILGETI